MNTGSPSASEMATGTGTPPTSAEVMDGCARLLEATPVRDHRKELFVGVVTGLIGDSGQTKPLGEILDAAHAAVLRFDEIFGASA